MLEKSVLEKFGYNVITADTGEKALEIVSSTTDIDLVLMDINLGDGMDGTEAAERILEKHELPLVFMSSHTEPEIVEKTDKITSYGYILKNSDETVLIASIKMAFRLFESKRKENEKNRALLESENKLREIIENSIDNIFVADVLPDGKFKVNTINGALEKFMNINRKDVENKLINEILPEIPARIISENFNKCLACGKNYSYEEVAEFYGEKTYYSTNLAPVFDETGKAVRVVGISRNITKQKLAGEKIQNLLHEKELILSEVHHRVKNNMNAIYGLLKIQAGAQKNKEANDVLQNAAGRVLSMSVLYDKLYRSEDNGAISIKKYLPALIDEIVGTFPQKPALKIETSIDDVILSSKILSPIGMIINELISNTMKYAFNGCAEGFIAVTAFKNEGRVSISVIDNGPGIPEPVTFDNSPGLGLRLVEMLVKQINGSITIERERGAIFTIEFDA
jgi:PAS domain S-box-containing protein